MEELELAIKELKELLPGLKILENEPMSAHCSFKTGGPARAVAVPSDVFSLSRICSVMKKHKIFPMALGNGTNFLFPDEGLPDMLFISTEKLQKIFLNEDGTIYAESGVSLSKLSGFAQQHGLKGLEFASGIPGTVGGGIWMNAGAYGGEMKDAVQSVVYYFYPDQGLYEQPGKDCQFGYRTSFFQKNPAIILSAVFALDKDDPEAIASRMREINEKRRAKQPLDLPSAGSAFKRPEGHYAAALIEECGLKGYRNGNAQVSDKHAGFVVNLGGATSKDVYDLMMHVRNEVYAQKQVELHPEIIILPPDYKLTDTSPAAPKNVTFTNGDYEKTAGGTGTSAAKEDNQ